MAIKKWMLGYLFGLLIITSPAHAAEDPLALLQKVTDQVMSSLKTNREAIKHNPQKINEVVQAYIIPHVDFTEMSRWVAGRTAWGKASPASQTEFVREFKKLVVRTYATALNNYTDETIEYLPRSPSTAKRIKVSSFVRRTSKEDIRVDYLLLQTGDTWRVYDIIIEGISILQGFRAQFSDDIKHQGLEAVTKKIEEHNLKAPKKA